MLDRLRNKSNTKNLKPSVWEGWIEDMDQEHKYAFVFIPSASMGLITDLENFRRCIAKIYRALKPDGKFVFEVETLKAIPEHLNIWKGSLRQYPDGKKILLSTLDLPLENNIGATICRYDLIVDNDIIKTEIEHFRIRLHDTNELLSMLKDLGFKKIKLIQPFNHEEAVVKNAEIVIYECQK